MADANYVRFNQRLREIDRAHKKLSTGYVRLEERNGVLVPVRRSRARRGLPVRGIILSLAVFLAFKGFLFAHLGAVTYIDRVAMLERGNIVEQMGAWAMRPDPITLFLADQINPFI